MEIKEFVKRYDNMIDHDLCDKIVNTVNFKEFEIATVGDKGQNKEIRNCYTKNIAKEFDDDIFNIVSSALDKYCFDFKWCNFGVAIEDTGYNHLLYKGVEGGEYKMHVDHMDLYPRVLSCSLILNDNYDGGDFVFFDEEYLIKKKKGSIVMFPSNFCFPHAVTPVSNGDRHAIITWIH
tara:strand:+ start:1322 stop:1855 length:534 start_codon:yes stop_codon:yes gene_type:complete